MTIFDPDRGLTPLRKLQNAVKTFATETGYPVPVAATLEMPGGLGRVPVPMIDPVQAKKPSLKDVAVLQAIKAAKGPITLKCLVRELGRSQTWVKDALRSLKARGLVEHVQGDGYREVRP
jgi:biotin operon repressor